jgi:hypothetical protein
VPLVAAELLADRVGEQPPVAHQELLSAHRHRPERAGGVGQRVAGIRAQLDVGGGDVELELLNTGRPGNRNDARQADEPGQPTSPAPWCPIR